MKAPWLAVWDRMRATYWAVPSVMAVVAIGLAVLAIDIDRAVSGRFLERLSWVYTGGAEGARAVLSTVASSMITVAGVAFSITIVALTLASQQFGPRLLRHFLRDLGNQITLGTFISTFLYCLVVLRTVRGIDDEEFVPHLAVTLGVALAMASIGVLIFFIHHIATSIQATQIIANVASDLDGAIARLFPSRIGHGAGISQNARTPEMADAGFERARAITATSSGYVQAIDSERLLALARKAGVVIRIDARPGCFVRPGAPLASVTPPGVQEPSFDDTLRSTFVVGAVRTGTQDVAFFIEQLVELAVRALSPGINDPGTARACIDRLEQALCHLAGRQLPSAYRYDEEGSLRIVARPVTIAGMLDVAFTEISRYGHSSVSVSCRLLEAMRDLEPNLSRHEDRLALARQAALVRELSANGGGERNQADIADCHRAFVAAFDGTRPDPSEHVTS